MNLEAYKYRRMSIQLRRIPNLKSKWDHPLEVRNKVYHLKSVAADKEMIQFLEEAGLIHLKDKLVSHGFISWEALKLYQVEDKIEIALGDARILYRKIQDKLKSWDGISCCFI